tara:strand:+ start:11098 stop:11682 length:585 start_codon:yes stop_codon:yes gene_type:complete
LNIAIIPTVREIYKDQLELCVDKRIFFLFNKVFKNKCSFKILNGLNNIENEKLIVILGGNTISNISKKKKNKIRSSLDEKYFLQAKKAGIKIVGICHGAQYIASLFGAKFKKSKSHVNKLHKIKFDKKDYMVNSYHNYIFSSYGKKILPLATCDDKSIEFFKINNFEIYGILWHPERYKRIKKLDLKILRKICN